jgi:hypothetical protein
MSLGSKVVSKPFSPMLTFLSQIHNPLKHGKKRKDLLERLIRRAV